ncbi:MAG: gliding motility protein GldL [Ginsengibacter sp.]
MMNSQKTVTEHARPKRNFFTVIDVLVSAGAAVVIFAAWAKLTHKPFADTMLTWGMWTETAIFLIYAGIEWVRPQPHPQTSVNESLPLDLLERAMKPQVVGNPALQSMEDMMQNAGINPINMKRLGDSFQRLDTTVSQLGEVGDVVKSTNDFSAKTREANGALSKMKEAFENSANTMGSFNEAADSAKGFHNQVQVLTKNLGSLNSVYELELSENNNHLKAMSGFYGTMAAASAEMVKTVDDAKATKEQMNQLATNLGKLNQVYGSMLSAMQGRQ